MTFSRDYSQTDEQELLNLLLTGDSETPYEAVERQDIPDSEGVSDEDEQWLADYQSGALDS